MVKVECAYCGEEIYKSPRDIRLSDKNFCSKECHYRYRAKDDLLRSERKEKIEENLEDEDMTHEELAEEIGSYSGTVKDAVRELREEGKIERKSKGVYGVA